MVAYMNKENKSNEQALTLLLNKHQKVNRIKVVIAFMLMILIVVAVVFVNSDKELGKQQEKKQIKIEDITVDGNRMVLNVDRKFYVYDKDPRYLDKDEPPAKILREIDVVFNGVADFATTKFEGEIKVEGYKLDGNLIGCCANKVFLDKDDEYHYSFSCINACEYEDGSETDNLRILQYDIEISSDLSEIYIMVWMRNDEENVYVYSKLE